MLAVARLEQPLARSFQIPEATPEPHKTYAESSYSTLRIGLIRFGLGTTAAMSTLPLAETAGSAVSIPVSIAGLFIAGNGIAKFIRSFQNFDAVIEDSKRQDCLSHPNLLKLAELYGKEERKTQNNRTGLRRLWRPALLHD